MNGFRTVVCGPGIATAVLQASQMAEADHFFIIYNENVGFGIHLITSVSVSIPINTISMPTPEKLSKNANLLFIYNGLLHLPAGTEAALMFGFVVQKYIFFITKKT
jgi:hypothetical protein